MADTAAVVNMTVPNNATWQDAFQFADPDATGWSFTGYKFIMELKGNPNDTSDLIELTSDAGEIVVDSESERVLHINVPKAQIVAALKVGEYVYDFIMYAAADPTGDRTVLMRGLVEITQGITGDP